MSDSKLYRFKNKIGNVRHVADVRVPPPNSLNTFSLVMEHSEFVRGAFRTCAWGQLKDDQERIFPFLSDVAKLHLSDGNGVPLHAVANGFYFLAGTFRNGLGSDYHAGNGHDAKNAHECLTLFIQTMRTDEAAARGLRAMVEGKTKDRAMEQVALFADAMRPQWRKDADHARAIMDGFKDSLVYGSSR